MNFHVTKQFSYPAVAFDFGVKLLTGRKPPCLTSFLGFAFNGSSRTFSFLVCAFDEAVLFENCCTLLHTGDFRISTSSDSIISASIEACTETIGIQVNVHSCNICMTQAQIKTRKSDVHFSASELLSNNVISSLMSPSWKAKSCSCSQ